MRRRENGSPSGGLICWEGNAGIGREDPTKINRLRRGPCLLRSRSHLLYGEDTAAVRPSELTETCGGRRETEVASGWPYAVWLSFTGRRVAVEL